MSDTGVLLDGVGWRGAQARAGGHHSKGPVSTTVMGATGGLITRDVAGGVNGATTNEKTGSTPGRPGA